MNNSYFRQVGGLTILEEVLRLQVKFLGGSTPEVLFRYIDML